MNNKSVTAKLRYLRLTPRKVRALARVIKGLTVDEAKAQLLLSPRRAGRPLLKLLHSAISNAKNNDKIDTAKLYVKEIKVDQGPKFKRWLPRARGSASLIEKKTSHIILTLGVSDKVKPSRFVIQEKTKKIKKEKHQKNKEKTMPPLNREAEGAIVKKPVVKEGFFRKVFRRKSV